MPCMLAEKNKLPERMCGSACNSSKKALAQGTAACGSTLNTLKKNKFDFIRHHHHHDHHHHHHHHHHYHHHHHHHHHPHDNHRHHHHHQPHSVYPASSGGGVNMVKQMERLQVLLAALSP